MENILKLISIALGLPIVCVFIMCLLEEANKLSEPYKPPVDYTKTNEEQQDSSLS